jgi:inosine-uridine nucleoside N-ribohydrolase
MEQVKEYYAKWEAIPQPRKIKALKLTSFICYFLFLLLLVIYAFGRTGKKTVPIIPTILFTDGTPYNLEVVRYLAQRRDVVMGMVVVATNSLAAAQLKANIAGVTGLISTLQSEGWKTHVPQVYGSYDSSTSNFLEPLETLLAKTTVNFLIVGPCTDAAYFLQKYPGRRSNVKTIYVAGGAFNVVGNAKYLNSSATTAERNFYMDPVAADYIVAMTHGRPVVMMPLDTVPTWDSSAYFTIVSHPATSSESAVEVAEGLQWYYSDVDKTNRVTVGIAAAAYAVDTQVQTGVTVTVIPVRVYTSTTDARYGGSYRPPTSADPNLVTVVFTLQSSTFFTRLVSVNALALA